MAASTSSLDLRTTELVPLCQEIAAKESPGINTATGTPAPLARRASKHPSSTFWSRRCTCPGPTAGAPDARGTVGILRLAAPHDRARPVCEEASSKGASGCGGRQADVPGIIGTAGMATDASECVTDIRESVCSRNPRSKCVCGGEQDDRPAKVVGCQAAAQCQQNYSL